MEPEVVRLSCKFAFQLKLALSPLQKDYWLTRGNAIDCFGEASSGDDDEIDLKPLTKINRFTHRSIIASNRSMIIASFSA